MCVWEGGGGGGAVVEGGGRTKKKTSENDQLNISRTNIKTSKVN